MVLVDTTVWIDFFGGQDSAQVKALVDLLEGSSNVCTCGIILTEVLQGIRDDEAYRKAVSSFENFLYLHMSRETFIEASALYRSLRRRGITVRKPVDCMIASVAMKHDVPLLHNDRDYDQIARHSELKFP